jgi:hypothetical protein
MDNMTRMTSKKGPKLFGQHEQETFEPFWERLSKLGAVANKERNQNPAFVFPDHNGVCICGSNGLFVPSKFID